VIQQSPEMTEKSTRNQYAAALIGQNIQLISEKISEANFHNSTVNIIAVSVGASVGWPSSFLPILQSSVTPLEQPLTTTEASWLGSILALGALIGTLLFGWLSERLGRFRALFITAGTEIVRYFYI
jgi:MFS family permease